MQAQQPRCKRACLRHRYFYEYCLQAHIAKDRDPMNHQAILLYLQGTGACNIYAANARLVVCQRMAAWLLVLPTFTSWSVESARRICASLHVPSLALTDAALCFPEEVGVAAVLVNCIEDIACSVISPITWAVHGHYQRAAATWSCQTQHACEAYAQASRAAFEPSTRMSQRMPRPFSMLHTLQRSGARRSQQAHLGSCKSSRAVCNPCCRNS
jgi:hypothetical protein